MTQIHHKIKTRNILVVDDEPQICELLSGYFQETGFQTSVAYNGVEALNLLKTTKPDLIILDVLMPKMDGFELLKNLKSNPDYSAIPVIILTAKSDARNVAKGVSLHADFYLPKPFSFDNLMNFVNLLLNEREG